MAQEFKLKGLSSLDLQGEEKKEFEVEGIEKAKILLINHKGTIHAMTSKCSHYGWFILSCEYHEQLANPLV